MNSDRASLGANLELVVELVRDAGAVLFDEYLVTYTAAEKEVRFH